MQAAINHDAPKREIVLITGASTGLGLAIAQRLLDLDYHLILTARRESLQRFAAAGICESGRVWLRALDVTNREQRYSVIAEACERLGGVDVLINNAGFAFRAVLEHVTEDNRLEQMEVNFRAPMELIRLVLPDMRAKRRGRIINISSVGGMMAMPTMGIYSASKFALEGASESLWYEVRPWGIHVSLVQPGFIRSSSFERVKYTNLSNWLHTSTSDPYHEHYHSMEPFIARLMKMSPSSPAAIARIVVKTMQRSNPPLRVPATPDARIFGIMRRLLPRGLYHALLYRLLPGVKRWGSKGAQVVQPLRVYNYGAWRQRNRQKRERLAGIDNP